MSETPWIVEFYDQNGKRITGTTSDKLPIIPRENESIRWQNSAYKIAHVRHELDKRKYKLYCIEVPI